jgi:predicted  nucleic acid-binding Zn-ribbon protein
MSGEPGPGQPGPVPAAPAPGGPPQGGTETSDRLQSLLATAAQSLQDEQRDVAGTLGDVRNQLMRLGQEIAELRADGSRDESSDASINVVTVELREAVRFLSERLDGVARMVAQRGEELADMRVAMTAVDSHVRSQAETIGVLSGGLQALPSYGESVSALQDAIEAMEQRLAGVELAVSRPPADTGLDERLDTIEGQLAALARQESIQSLQSRLDSVAESTRAMLSAPPSFDGSSITALDQRVTTIVEEISALRADVASLAATPPPEAPEAPAGLSRDEVDQAVRESEDRLRAHVDEAVLALAETLLRRPPARTRQPQPADAEVASDAELPFEAAAPSVAEVPSVAAGQTVPSWEPAEPIEDTESIEVDALPVEAPAEDSRGLAEVAADEPGETAGGGWSPVLPVEQSERPESGDTVIPERKRRWFGGNS